MNKKISKHIAASPGKWLVRLVVIGCILGIVLIEFGMYFARPLVTAKSINLRATPHLSGKQITRINQGARLSVIDKNEQTGWWQVKANGKTGWVASWLIDQPKYNAANNDKLAEATIVLDPGHGGQDTGTLSHFGSGAANEEKTYTLPLALRVRQLLKSSYARVIMSRTTDETVGLQHRADLANNSKADLFMSFHYNSSNQANDATGFEVFKYHENAEVFAGILENNFGNLPLKDRGVAFGNYLVLRNNTRPAVLIEMGFLDNSDDLKLIRSGQYRNQVAKDVVKSMQQYFDAE